MALDEDLLEPTDWQVQQRQQSLEALNAIPDSLKDGRAVRVVRDLINHDPCKDPATQKRPGGYEIRDLKHMGRAVVWSMAVNVLTWGTLMGAPLVADRATDMGWMVFSVGYLLTVMLLKFMVARICLPCFAHICGPIGTLRTYAVKLVASSVLSSVDILSNTLFVARFAKQTAWIWCLYAVMWLQPLYVFVYCVPVATVTNRDSAAEFPITYQILQPHTAHYNRSLNAVYQTFLEQVQTHQGALLSLAHGGRIQLVIQHMAVYFHEFHETRLSSFAAHKLMKQYLLRSVIFTFFETVLVLAVKGEVALETCGSGNCDWVALMGVVVGSITGLLAIVNDCTVMWSTYKDALIGHWNYWELSQSNRAAREGEERRMEEAGACLVLQALLTGGCVLGLLQLPLRISMMLATNNGSFPISLMPLRFESQQ